MASLKQHIAIVICGDDAEGVDSPRSCHTVDDDTDHALEDSDTYSTGPVPDGDTTSDASKGEKEPSSLGTAAIVKKVVLLSDDAE